MDVFLVWIIIGVIGAFLAIWFAAALAYSLGIPTKDVATLNCDVCEEKTEHKIVLCLGLRSK